MTNFNPFPPQTSDDSRLYEQLTFSTGIQSHVPVSHRREAGDPSHGGVGRGLPQGVATCLPLLSRLHDHRVVLDRRATPTGEGAFKPGTLGATS